MAVAIGLTTANKKSENIMAKTQNQEQNKSALKPIIFYQGEENGIVVETNNYEYSIFENQYKRAFQIFDRIVNKQQPCNEFYNKENRGGVASSLSIEVDNQYSNIVAFCGDRGEGKSSCMSSFAAMLSTEEARAAAIKADLVSDKYVSFKDIELVDTIDPSSFDSTHNIIELLVGRMFYHVKKESFKQDDCGHPQYDYDQRLCKRSPLLKQFEKVKSSMAILNNKEIKYDSMEEVDDLAVGLRLKNEIEELFKQYLDYKGKKHLVLCIDDLDLNMTEGYKMAEMIRKYLVNPYCILLVAVKVDQLVNVIATAIEQETKGSKIIMDVQCLPMAQAYVVKLLPQSNRVDMPHGNEIAEKEVEIYDSNGKVLTNGQTVKETVVRLIYDKTRFIFVNGAGLSPIVPTNLRSLRVLVGTLCNLNNASKNTAEHVENKMVFKNYFYKVWTNNLDENNKRFVDQLVAIEDVRLINKYVISHLQTLLSLPPKTVGRVDADDKLLQSIVDANNAIYNVSLGDAFYVIRCIDQISTDLETKNVLFFIKAFYSIKLYELYDQISDMEEHLFPKSQDNTPSIYKYDTIFQEENALQKLLNGAYFSYANGSLLPGSKDKGQTCDRRQVNLKNIANTMTELLKKRPKKLSADDVKKLNTVEFFALTTLYTTGEDSKMAEDQNFGVKRTSIDPYYLLKYDSSKPRLVFDVLSIFYNLVNVKWCYSKLDNLYKVDTKQNKMNDVSFYNFALSADKSLLNQMLLATAKKEQEDSSKLSLNQHGLISDVVIRFSEVQLAILDGMRNNYLLGKYKSSGNNTNKLYLFYNGIKESNISLYPLHNEAKGYSLPFNFLTPIIDFLRNCEDDFFDSYFDIELRKLDTVGLDVARINIARWFPNLIKAIGVSYPLKGARVVDILKESCPQVCEATKRRFAWGTVFPSSKMFDSPDQIYKALLEKYPRYSTFLSGLKTPEEIKRKNQLEQEEVESKHNDVNN